MRWLDYGKASKIAILFKFYKQYIWLVSHLSQSAIFLMLWCFICACVGKTDLIGFYFIYNIFLLRLAFKKRQDFLCIISSFTVNLRLLESCLVREFDEVVPFLNSRRFLLSTKLRISYIFLSAYTSKTLHLDNTSDITAWY